ncbi:hypothetical protein KOW79_001990 [Hemibagrus wyckioides]|uniref:Apolipoprotein L3 n=1 Tax=Hemibagrus wyckioides TaxID=337641 RepID=A0A9D3P7F4_9TELE|nr:uncharacterized protein LOC131365756 [Hemibagrus wyckioides]KAG7335394.1 hypothetical protein KOW79_001990 [Hemibagrus wyckioides]
MSSNTREKLQQQMSDYILDTLKYAETVKEFCDRESKWTLQRETELEMMRDIKDRADQITLKFEHVQKAEDKTKAFGEFMRSSFTQVTADSRRQELEKELGEVLKNTLEGLEKLQHFLDAVEKLAVTSLFVFMGESFMPKGVSSMSVRSVISAARMVCPLLVHFKRDAGAFFQPSLSNVEVLASQLEKYIQVTQQICEKMEKKSKYISGSEGVPEWINGKFHLYMTEVSVQKQYDHLLQLTKIRMDESFRLTFLFNNKAQDFILIFSEHHSRILQFLSDLDEAADQLDKMKLGSNISTVAGSSVGIAGGALTIAGLALAPVTAGASLGLTITAAGLGVACGTNSLARGIAKIAVKSRCKKTTKDKYSRFKEDVQKILDCMDIVASRDEALEDSNNVNMLFETVKLGKHAGKVLRKASSVKALSKNLAKGAPVALSKTVRVGFICINAFFIGLDVYSICKNSISLSKGSKNEEAQLNRSRSVLWHSEVKAWEKIHDHLHKGISEFNKNLEILEQPLYFDQHVDLQ